MQTNPFPLVQQEYYAPLRLTNEKFDRAMEMKYRQFPTKKFWEIIASLPLQEDDEGREFFEIIMSLDQAL